ncbi:hypothetical protein HYV57_02320 [Candidatus Peregrinibacteria bacterium]|nr:hypothetical protein [Candidatus Peregrinibacteria bacterium]
MHKFTIFTIILSIIVIAVTVDLVVNEYWKNNPSGIQNSLSNAAPNVLDADNSQKTVSDDSLLPVSNISNDLARSAGIIDPQLKEVSFNGKLFQFIDLSAYGFENITKTNVFDGSDFRFSVYEIHSDHPTLAKEMYKLIQEEASKNSDISANETNQYGDQSFYINHSLKKQTVFLLVLMDSSVYAFEYPRSSHDVVKSILDSLKASIPQKDESIAFEKSMIFKNGFKNGRFFVYKNIDNLLFDSL